MQDTPKMKLTPREEKLKDLVFRRQILLNAAKRREEKVKSSMNTAPTPPSSKK